MYRDLTGYPVTCSDEKALQSFNDGALAVITLRENGFPMLQKALELDNNLIVAHCIIVRPINSILSAFTVHVVLQAMFMTEGLHPPTGEGGKCCQDL